MKNDPHTPSQDSFTEKLIPQAEIIRLEDNVQNLARLVEQHGYRKASIITRRSRGYHGMIDQIPSAVHGITCGRGRMGSTPLGRVSLHHVQSDFFVGYVMPTKIGWLKIATPEKAIVDLLYLRMTSRGDFKGLPEVEWPKNFKWSMAQKFARLTPADARRQLILSALEDLRTTLD